MRLLLDTAVFIYMLESPQHLSRRAREMLDSPDHALEFSTVSLVEIGIKTSRGLLRMSPEKVKNALAALSIRILPYTAAHAFRFFQLPLRHRDPFDRQIISQALAEEIPIISPDRKFELYDGLKIFW